MSDDKDYAHQRDPEAQRTRYELWAIIIIVAVVVIGAIVYRAVAHKPAGPQRGYGPSDSQYTNDIAPAAAAGVRAPTPPPAPRPAAP
jgi:hypothetical protein